MKRLKNIRSTSSLNINFLLCKFYCNIVEKMFQLKLSISSKSKELFEDYVRSLLPLEKEEIWDIIDHVDLNPRAIKRILNLVYFVIFDISIPGKTND